MTFVIMYLLFLHMVIEICLNLVQITEILVIVCYWSKLPWFGSPALNVGETSKA